MNPPRRIARRLRKRLARIRRRLMAMLDGFTGFEAHTARSLSRRARRIANRIEPCPDCARWHAWRLPCLRERAT